MEYMNIISKEPITTVPIWGFIVIGTLCIVAVLSTIIYARKVKDIDKTFVYLLKVGFGAIIFELVAMCIYTSCFRVPTDRYKYEGTVNKDLITVTQYEEFIEEYDPIIKDGIYYWEDKVE